MGKTRKWVTVSVKIEDGFFDDFTRILSLGLKRGQYWRCSRPPIFKTRFLVEVKFLFPRRAFQASRTTNPLHISCYPFQLFTDFVQISRPPDSSGVRPKLLILIQTLPSPLVFPV